MYENVTLPLVPDEGNLKFSTVTFLSWDMHTQKAKNLQTFDPLFGGVVLGIHLLHSSLKFVAFFFFSMVV